MHTPHSPRRLLLGALVIPSCLCPFALALPTAHLLPRQDSGSNSGAEDALGAPPMSGGVGGSMNVLGKPMATNNFVTKLYQYVYPRTAPCRIPTYTQRAGYPPTAQKYAASRSTYPKIV